MSLPGGITTITVTGSYSDALGNPAGGTVLFTPGSALTDSTGMVILTATPISCHLVDGEFSVVLPCTDNTTLRPVPFYYLVTQAIGDVGTQAPFAISLPHTLGSTVDMSSLSPIPVIPAPTSGLYVISVNGQSGSVTVTQLDNVNVSGTPTAGQVLTATGTTAATWQTPSGGGGGGGGPFLLLAGGTLTGPLILTETPDPPSPSSLPVGAPGDSTAITGIQVVSSYPTDDVPGGIDGTGRLSLYSYQRAHTNLFGETIRNFLMRWDAKAMTAWYGPDSLYDGSGNPIAGNWHPWVWTGAHYEADDHASIHAHWEVEVPDSTGAMQGRFEVPFGNTTTGAIGLDLTVINTNLANFHVWCHGTDHTGTYQEQYLRLTAPAGFEKPLEWNNDNQGATASRRWKLAATSDAESGGNTGTNLSIFRYDDSGNLLDTPFVFTRSTGQLLLGGSSGTAGGLKIQRNGGAALLVQPLATDGTGIQVQGTDNGANALVASATADTISRYAVTTGGVTSWGPGSNTARDTNLYRLSAGVLKTDNTLSVGTNLLVTGTTALTGEVTVPNAVNANDAVAYGQIISSVQPWQPSDLSLLAWNYDAQFAITGSAPSNNTLQLIRVNVRASISATNVVYFVTSVGSSLTSNENFAGLYDSAGTLIGTSADQSTIWTSTGLKTTALTGGPFALTAGFYWVALLANSTGSVPQLLRNNTGLTATSSNLGFTASTARFATGGNATSLANITPANNVLDNHQWWAGLS